MDELAKVRFRVLPPVRLGDIVCLRPPAPFVLYKEGDMYTDQDGRPCTPDGTLLSSVDTATVLRFETQEQVDAFNAEYE